jgi:membrane dipeptidase
MTPQAGGLTPFGRELVREMAALSMIVDVSHLSDRGFEEVSSLLPGPFVASHSDSRAVCGHPRNLTDEQFCEIVRRGGLVGLNLCPAFLAEKPNPGYTAVLPHIGHFLSMGGENILAVGADFDGAPLPDGIGGIADIGKLRQAVASAFSETIAEKIFFGNALRFLNSALTESENCYTISVE